MTVTDRRQDAAVRRTRSLLHRAVVAVWRAWTVVTERVHVFRIAMAASIIAAVVLALIETPIGVRGYDLPIAVAFGLAVLHAASLPLALLRPGRAALLAITAALVQQGLSGHESGVWPWWPALVVTQTLVLFVVGTRLEWPYVLLHWVLAVGASAILVAVVRPGEDGTAAATVVVFGGISAGALMVAVALAQWRGIRMQLVKERRVAADEVARRVLIEERARIARELHDVIAHSMSIISVQSSTARFRHPEFAPEAVAEFDEIGALSRQALDEMRGLLAVLRSADAAPRHPQPRLGDLPELVETAERAGMRVSFTPLAPADLANVSEVTGLAAYRIVQEAVSNAIRHAPGSAVTIRFERDGPALRLEVANSPSVRPAPLAVQPPFDDPDPAPGPGEGGHGLIGMTERAASVGGRLSVGPTPDGGFAVTASLPLTAILSSPR